MKHAPVHSKSPRHDTSRSQHRPVTGPNGISIAPPAYGIDFLDRQQSAGSGNLALDATIQRQAREESSTPQRQQENNTGLSDHLKTGIESLSGVSLDDVHVHYNSTKPAALQALAYTQGTDIHVAPGQEQHLPHEAWHVVQQAQGRVQPTVQMKDGVSVNDDKGLEHEATMMGAKVAVVSHLAVPSRLLQGQAERTGVYPQRKPIGGQGEKGPLNFLSSTVKKLRPFFPGSQQSFSGVVQLFQIKPHINRSVVDTNWDNFVDNQWITKGETDGRYYNFTLPTGPKGTGACHVRSESDGYTNPAHVQIKWAKNKAVNYWFGVRDNGSIYAVAPKGQKKRSKPSQH